MNGRLIDLIQTQAGREQLASLRYLAWALWCNQAGFPGCEAFLRAASADEIGHRDRWLAILADYADILPTVASAPDQRESPPSLLALFRDVAQLERDVTAYVRAISRAAKDVQEEEIAAACVWFLNEQIASVSEILTIIRQLANAGEDMAAVLAIDRLIGETAKG